uniref:Terpene synthase n=2 Tax=Oryza brachyantha TaxID=4533 RepID=J3LCK2_ORYBR
MAQAEKLKEDVANIIATSVTCTLLERLQLIDALERLCVNHLFEEEINVLVMQISGINVTDCDDLHTVALWFYILRKHGYRVSQDVFAKFKDQEGCFAVSNPRDLLSLYNAAYLGTQGETILDDAISFTRMCLESAHANLEGSLAREIKCALDIPLPRRVRIYEAKEYILIYEREQVTHETILELAKLNSNIMQLHYQDELKIISRWWKDLQIESRLSFARDRIVECYFWIVGVYYEPRYSRGRIILTMVIAIVTLLDDIYDIYGSSEDCELFTRCMERWDQEAAHDIPEYMKFVYRKVLDAYKYMEDLLAEEEKFRISYLRNLTIELVRAFNTEVKWRDARYVPASVEEHLHISTRSGGCYLLSCASLVGMDHIATKESFIWVSSAPKIVRALCIILRLSDDLETYEREQVTLHVASTINSYMKEHNVSIESACEKIKELIEDTWKDFNDEWLTLGNVQQKQLLERIFNLARTMEFMYKQEDKFTNSHSLRDRIQSLFIEILYSPNDS